ncbi:MAG: exodeoxyribonuclease VII small subunit [Phycisphaerales bacterium]
MSKPGNPSSASAKGAAGTETAGAEASAGVPFDFESAVSQIESIVERIESGEVGLEGSITEYEKGVALIKRCREVLERAEQRVQDLTSQLKRPESGR